MLETSVVNEAFLQLAKIAGHAPKELNRSQRPGLILEWLFAWVALWMPMTMT
jgi:hypothetical protein